MLENATENKDPRSMIGDFTDLLREDPEAYYCSLGIIEDKTDDVLTFIGLAGAVKTGLKQATKGVLNLVGKAIPKKESNFASKELLEEHFERHSGEFKKLFKSADDYLLGAQDVVKNGIRVSYPYTGEVRTGYVRFMENTRKGEAKFEFVGTNNEGYITTYHAESGKTF